MERRTVENKSIPLDVAAAVTAIGAAVPAGIVVGRAIRQVVDNIKDKEGK